MGLVSDRLSVRWYLGYDLFEALPDHSSLTRIRERFGLSVFRSFFERIVWASPARADTIILRDPSFSYSILLEIGRTHVAQR